MGPNPDLYREMSRPFASTEEASKAIDGFYDDLEEIRKKHRIGDIYCVLMVSVISDGQEGNIMTVASIGNELLWESMAAFAFGRETTAREERIAKLAARGVRNRKAK